MTVEFGARKPPRYLQPSVGPCLSVQHRPKVCGILDGEVGIEANMSFALRFVAEAGQ